jgi:hypothetical protein
MFETMQLTMQLIPNKPMGNIFAHFGSRLHQNYHFQNTEFHCHGAHCEAALFVTSQHF